MNKTLNKILLAIVLVGVIVVGLLIIALEGNFLSDKSWRTTVDALGPPHAILESQLYLVGAILVVIFAFYWLYKLTKSVRARTK